MLRADVRAGRIVEPHRMTVDQYLTQWLDSIAGPKLRVPTREEYARLLGHVRKHLGGLLLTKLAKIHLASMHGE